MIYVILGYLFIKSLSQYDLKKILERDVSPFYSPSLGSIQSALKKLEQLGCIEKVANHDTGRKKYMYHITDKGKAYWRSWLVSDYESSKFDAQLNTRLFFLGLVDIDDRLIVVDKAINFLDKKILAFEHEAGKNHAVDKAFEEIARYQLKSLDLGIHTYKETKTWLIALKGDLR